MPTVSEVILKAAPRENAGIGLNIEERVPRRWYRKVLAWHQVLLIAVCRFEHLLLSDDGATSGSLVVDS